jgi:hypothetical protein
MDLTPGQLGKIIELADEWSFLWDKRRWVWIAAQDSPDGEQFEEADLDALLDRIEQHPGLSAQPGGRPDATASLRHRGD